MEKNVLVYLDLLGTSHLVGRLWARTRNDRQSASFEYDKTGKAVSTWRSEAAKLRLAAHEIERMASAFEHEDLKLALRK
jgi:predicted negative regulator of RcsB-dependent stress response